MTGGSRENMKLLHAGKVGLALTVADVAWDAAQGTLKEFPEKVAVRTLLWTYAAYLHIVTLEGSGIRAVADLRGKRVSMGPAGGGSGGVGLLVFEASGVMPQDLGSHLRLDYPESAAALREGKLDAFLMNTGVRAGVIRELAATPGTKMRLIPHGDAAPKLAAKHPVYFAAPIPKGPTRAWMKTFPPSPRRLSSWPTNGWKSRWPMRSPSSCSSAPTSWWPRTRSPRRSR